MQTLFTSARGAFKTVMTAGVLALAAVGTTVATAEPAAANVRHGGGFHRVGGFYHGGFRHGGFGHRFAYGGGRAFGHYGVRRAGFGFRPYGFRHAGFAYRPYGYGLRRFAYGVRYAVPSRTVLLRRCGYGRHFVPGLGCRLNVAYRVLPARIGYRPYAYGVRRVVRPYGVARYAGYGFDRFAFRGGRHFGGYAHGFRQVGFGHGGFGHGGVHHGFGHGGFHHGHRHMR